jgi:hypothetical protein
MMIELDEAFILFRDPRRKGNQWRGSLSYDRITGSKIRVVSHLQDRETNFRQPFDVDEFADLAVEADLINKAVMFDLGSLGHTLSYRDKMLTAEARFSANAVAIGPKKRLKDAKTTGIRFFVSSPIVFSFMNQKPYELTARKRGHRFTIQDSPTDDKSFSSRIFSKIEFSITKSATDSVDGDVAKINYGATAGFTPRKPMDLWSIYRLSQLFEKLLFLFVGSHCGPMRIDVSGRKKRSEVCTIYCSSVLYADDTVVNGLQRCWTLDKLKVDFGAAFDTAIANYQTFETALELVIDARAETSIQSRFFKLVRAMENIGRTFFPAGSETEPEELAHIEQLISNEALRAFFEQRVRPIFNRPNSLGYTIDFAKSAFPFWPVTELDKRRIARLRGIEAHARAHQFDSDDLSGMRFYAEILDFVCRACLLLQLGVSFDDVMSSIYPHSRFSWFVQEQAKEAEQESSSAASAAE